MRSVIIVAMLFVMASGCVSAKSQAGNVEVEHDEAGGQRWVSLDGIEIPNDDFESDLMTGRARLGGPAVLTFIYRAKVWQFIRCDDQVEMFVDRAPMRPDAIRWDGDTEESGVVENMVMSFEADAMGRLEAATTIELRICQHQVTLTPINVQSINELMRQARTAASIDSSRAPGDP